MDAPVPTPPKPPHGMSPRSLADDLAANGMRGVRIAAGHSTERLKQIKPPMFRQGTANMLTGPSRVWPDNATNGRDSKSMRAAALKLLERPRSSRLAKAFFGVVVVAIAASTMTWALGTVEGLENNVSIMVVEALCGAVFTAELALRLFATPSAKALVLDPTFYVDVISLIPFFITVGGWIGGADSSSLPSEVKLLRLLGVLRVLKLLRHYSGWRVLIIAVKRSWRPVFVPMFAILVTTLILGGILQHFEKETFPDAFDSMWAVFWLVLTLGYDGDLGSSSYESRLLIAVALICGVLFTTMPITIIGNAFAAAWDKKEVIEVAMDVQEFLQERGLKPQDVRDVFKEFDPDGSGTLDWDEFQGAMRTLNNKLPFNQMKRLFKLFDGDDNGRVDLKEFCSLIFPGLEFATDTPRDTPRDGSLPSPPRTGRSMTAASSDIGGSPPNGSPAPEACSELVLDARKLADDFRGNKTPSIGAQIQELRQMTEELAAGMKLIHRHLKLGPYDPAAPPPKQARSESPA